MHRPDAIVRLRRMVEELTALVSVLVSALVSASVLVSVVAVADHS